MSLVIIRIPLSPGTEAGIHPTTIMEVVVATEDKEADTGQDATMGTTTMVAEATMGTDMATMVGIITTIIITTTTETMVAIMVTTPTTATPTKAAAMIRTTAILPLILGPSRAATTLALH